MKIIKLLLSVVFISNYCLAQYAQAEILSRISGLQNGEAQFLTIDGMEVVSRRVNARFTPQEIVREFKQFKVKKRALTTKDNSLTNNNFVVKKSETLMDGGFYFSYHYFVQLGNDKLLGVNFMFSKIEQTQLIDTVLNMLINEKIPDSVFSPMRIDSINFVGRKIELGPSCQWRGVNNVQCPWYGQMSWSLHHSLKEAQTSLEEQLKSSSERKGLKMLSDTLVPVTFEGKEVEARKVIVGMTGTNAIGVGMSGGKALTIYYVATEIRGKFVCCVMSFWNNDTIELNGLPPLLNKVMKPSLTTKLD